VFQYKISGLTGKFSGFSPASFTLFTVILLSRKGFLPFYCHQRRKKSFLSLVLSFVDGTITENALI